MKLAEIETFFSISNHFSWINLSGGEIFLRRDLPEIIDIILKKCENLYLLDFPTNGYEVDRIVDVVMKIISGNVLPKLLVTVSLDGPPDLHDRIRNRPGAWDRAVATFVRLRKLRSNSLNVFFGMTLQHANMDSYNEMLRAVNCRIGGVRDKDIHINIVHSSPHYYGNMNAPSCQREKLLWDRLACITQSRTQPLFDPVGFLEKRYQTLSGRYLATNRTPVPCQALCASFFMDPAGIIYPCSIYDKPVGKIADFGYDIKKLWATEERLKLRQEIKKGKCSHCWTPCEAYQSILARMIPRFEIKDNL
jgi:MoaA/NifB/PqqE/SkfB family radical SAM enzyme